MTLFEISLIREFIWLKNGYMVNIVKNPRREPIKPARIPIFANENMTLFIIKLLDAPININRFIVLRLYIIDVCVPYVMM